MPSTDVQPQVTLRTFGREDFERLISWVPTEARYLPWCGASSAFRSTQRSWSGTRRAPNGPGAA